MTGTTNDIVATTLFFGRGTPTPRALAAAIDLHEEGDTVAFDAAPATVEVHFLDPKFEAPATVEQMDTDQGMHPVHFIAAIAITLLAAALSFQFGFQVDPSVVRAMIGTTVA